MECNSSYKEVIFLLLRMDFSKLNQCPVMGGVDSSELNELFSKVFYTIRSFSSEEIIMTNGDVFDYMLILLEGEVRGEIIDLDGNATQIENITAPKPLAPAFLFGEKNTSPVDIIANEASKVMFIHKSEVLKLFQLNSLILKNFLDIISSKGQFLSRKVKLLSFQQLNQRIAFYVLNEYHRLPNKKITQQELAETLGVARPSLARTLKQMKQTETLEMAKGQLKILNEKRLRDLL